MAFSHQCLFELKVYIRFPFCCIHPKVGEWALLEVLKTLMHESACNNRMVKISKKKKKEIVDKLLNIYLSTGFLKVAFALLL